MAALQLAVSAALVVTPAKKVLLLLFESLLDKVAHSKFGELPTAGSPRDRAPRLSRSLFPRGSRCSAVPFSLAWASFWLTLPVFQMVTQAVPLLQEI
jgi:hypothetical protein